MNRIFYTWEDVHRAVDHLCSLLKKEKFEYVSGLPRGGLIPAVMISHKLNRKYLDISELSYFTYPNALIVDDIYDSGETLKAFIKKGYLTATIDRRHSTVGKPDYFSYIANDGDWIVYPWEGRNSKTKQDYLINE